METAGGIANLAANGVQPLAGATRKVPDKRGGSKIFAWSNKQKGGIVRLPPCSPFFVTAA